MVRRLHSKGDACPLPRGTCRNGLQLWCLLNRNVVAQNPQSPLHLMLRSVGQNVLHRLFDSFSRVPDALHFSDVENLAQVIRIVGAHIGHLGG